MKLDEGQQRRVDVWMDYRQARMNHLKLHQEAMAREVYHYTHFPGEVALFLASVDATADGRVIEARQAEMDALREFKEAQAAYPW